MSIIEVNHVTKEYKLGRLTSLKQTALDDIAIGADSASNAFCRSGFSRENRKLVFDPNGTYLSGSIIDVGWVRRAVCAVTHQMCRQALIKKCIVLLRNAWWVTQKTLTHPTFGLSKCHSCLTLLIGVRD